MSLGESGGVWGSLEESDNVIYEIIQQMKDDKTSETYINPIVSVLTGHLFTKSNVFRVESGIVF